MPGGAFCFIRETCETLAPYPLTGTFLKKHSRSVYEDDRRGEAVGLLRFLYIDDFGGVSHLLKDVVSRIAVEGLD